VKIFSSGFKSRVEEQPSFVTIPNLLYRLYRLLVFSMICFCLVGCLGKRTTDPAKAFKYWSGVNPPDELKLLRAQYWESPHFSKEYILYLSFESSDEEWNSYVDYNSLVLTDHIPDVPLDAPNWFQPRSTSEVYSQSGSFDNGSRYFHLGLNLELKNNHHL